MISFIIIGRNEGWKITSSLISVFRTIANNNLKDYEVIYVDSNSSDDSVERAKKFDHVKIIKLVGIFNAAIARNVGEKGSKGDTLFFIDGDMEINPEFLPIVYAQESGLIYPFISGQIKNFNHDENGNFVNQSWQYKDVLKGDRFYSTTGGVFLIERRLWQMVAGMDIRFKRGQDLELALRLAKKGYKILRKKEIIANHHTISYIHKSRLWKTLLSGDISYSNSYLYRKHFFNPNVFEKIIKTNYTLLALLFFPLIGFISGLYFISLAYILAILLKSIKNKDSTIMKKLSLILFYFVRDLFVLFYFVRPIPKVDESEIKFTTVK